MIVAHAHIEVATPEAQIAFYCDGLGSSLKRRLSPGWIELASANLPVFLPANRPSIAELGKTTAQRICERHWTPVHPDFIVDDLDAMVARLQRLGGTLDREIRKQEYGRIACMADPFGNGFDLTEFSGEGYEGVSRS